jgi:hypothetical protein
MRTTSVGSQVAVLKLATLIQTRLAGGKCDIKTKVLPKRLPPKLVRRMSSAGNPIGGIVPRQITFNVKSSSNGSHTITIAETATVLDLKDRLSGDDYEKISIVQQKLIYSGR